MCIIYICVALWVAAAATSAAHIDFGPYDAQVKCRAGSSIMCDAFPIRAIMCHYHEENVHNLTCVIDSRADYDRAVEYHIVYSYCFTQDVASCRIEYVIDVRQGLRVFWRLLTFQCAMILHTIAAASVQAFQVLSQSP